MIKSFSHDMSYGRDGLRAQHLMDCLSGAAVGISDELIAYITLVVNLFLDGKCPKTLGEYTTSALLTPLVKPGGGIRSIAVGTVWRRLVSKGGEAILHAVNRLIEDRSDDIGLSMLLVDFKNAFNLGDPLGTFLFALVLHPLICKIKDSFNLSLHAWYLDDGTIIGDTLVVEKVLELIMEDGPLRGLHLNVDKTKVFWPKEDPRSRLVGVFPPAITRPLHGVKLLDGPVNVDFDFSYELVWKRVAKSIELMDAVAKLNDPQCELLLLRACAAFNVKMKIDLLCNPSEIVALKLMKKLVDIYFTSVTQMAESTFSLSPRQMALWKSQMEDHTSDWLRVVLISGFFKGDIYGDHAVSCAGIVGIKHQHNVVRDTLVDICHRSEISSGKEVDIGLKGGRDKSLRPADVFLYSLDCGRALCVDLTGSSPITQTGMVDFVPGQAVVDAAQRKRGKYLAKCAAIGYRFLPFSFSSFGELEADAVSLLKRIRKFSMTQDIRARVAVHIFNRISFSIAKGVGA
nr:hypothetical protein [Tanacetum cinerariifolium]